MIADVVCLHGRVFRRQEVLLIEIEGQPYIREALVQLGAVLVRDGNEALFRIGSDQEAAVLSLLKPHLGDYWRGRKSRQSPAGQ